MPSIKRRLAAILLSTCAAGAGAGAATPPAITLRPAERLLVIAPHPDDETLAAGGLIQRVLAGGGTARVVIATAGDGYVEAVTQATGKPAPTPADYLAYGALRLDEAAQAVRTLGTGLRLDLWGFPDAGLEGLLAGHWQRGWPLRSVTTGQAQVPYRLLASRHTPYDGQDLLKLLLRVLRETRPSLVVFPDALDWHPDHHALGLFVPLALSRWPASATQRPQRLAYLVHWRHDWPAGADAAQPQDQQATPLYPPDDLPRRGQRRACLSLSPQEVQTKQAALRQHQTQQHAMGPFVAAFVRSTECFSVLSPAQVRRLAPRQPP